MPPRRVHESELDWDEEEDVNGMDFRQKRLAAAAGGADLGGSLYEIEPDEYLFDALIRMSASAACGAASDITERT